MVIDRPAVCRRARMLLNYCQPVRAEWPRRRRQATGLPSARACCRRSSTVGVVIAASVVLLLVVQSLKKPHCDVLLFRGQLTATASEGGATPVESDCSPSSRSPKSKQLSKTGLRQFLCEAERVGHVERAISRPCMTAADLESDPVPIHTLNFHVVAQCTPEEHSPGPGARVVGRIGGEVIDVAQE